MSKKLAGMLAVALFAAFAVYASDVWKDKDYQNWDQKDVDKILKDSPWSKHIQFGGGGAEGMPSTWTGAGDAAHNDSVSGSGGGGGGRTTGVGGTSAMQGAGQQMDFTICWYSSRTIREALARRRELSGGTTSEDARKTLSTELATYQVLVQSRNLSMFGVDAEALKAHSYLMLKSTKEKLIPQNVVIQKGQNDKAVAIIYEFAKKSASGEPAINANEKSVEFYAEAGKTPLKTTFELSKMADKQGADY